MSEKEDYDETIAMLKKTTQIIFTPDDYNEGMFLMYSEGMYENYDLEDLEVRNVPGMFSKACGNLINELNAYRIINRDNPVLVGHNIGWSCGDIIVEASEVYDNMLLLTSRLTDIECCVGCEAKEAGVTA
tara:strand:- start:157 stop:546 length:390 start_codon:yes stop_codon:yes gene_type:complete